MLRIDKASWERIYLRLCVYATEGELTCDSVHFFLLDSSDEISAEFVLLDRTENTALLQLNITNLGINCCVENGNYRVIAANGNVVIGPVLCEKASEILASWNNHFLYNGSNGCYTVTFLVDQFALQPELQILFYDMKVSKKRNVSREIC